MREFSIKRSAARSAIRIAKVEQIQYITSTPRTPKSFPIKNSALEIGFTSVADAVPLLNSLLNVKPAVKTTISKPKIS
jgi:hypothetical protein